MRYRPEAGMRYVMKNVWSTTGWFITRSTLTAVYPHLGLVPVTIRVISMVEP